VPTVVLLGIVLSCPLGAVLVKVSVSVVPLKAIVAVRVRSLLTSFAPVPILPRFTPAVDTETVSFVPLLPSATVTASAAPDHPLLIAPALLHSDNVEVAPSPVAI